jgi:hypothetical protein
VIVAQTEDFSKKGAIFFCFVFFAYPYALPRLVHDMKLSISIFRFSRQGSQILTQKVFTVGTVLAQTVSPSPLFIFLSKTYRPFGCVMMVFDRYYAHCPVLQHVQKLYRQN